MKTVFVNVAKCVGCRHCEMACAIEHCQPNELFALLQSDPQPQPRIRVGLGIHGMTFPNRCRHCEPAPCLHICPTGSLYREEASHAVLVKEELCISCGMCAMVCPYSTITFHKVPGANNRVSYKCDDCLERQKEGKEPACVAACRTRALVFGDINDLINQAKHDIVMKITRELKGAESSEIPENIRLFQQIQEKITQLGPLPSLA